MTKTSRGTPLTDDVLDRLTDEAQAGYSPGQLRTRRGRGRPRLSEGAGPSDSINIRIDDETRERLHRRAEHEDTTTSQIVREALRRYLAHPE